MRLTTLAAALALALSGTSIDASAAEGSDQEIAELKAQVQALMARIDDLEARTEAQTDVNIDTATALDALTNNVPKLETKGGIKVTSPDKLFSASLGGRIHFDGYAFDRDIAATTGGTEFRRARLTLSGMALGWEYKMEQDFAAGNNLDGLRDLYIAKAFGLNKLTIGQFKPYRSMEELTSSNEILMMERPFASATGLFGGRQFQQGVGMLRSNNLNYSAGFSVFNLRSAPTARNEGLGWSGRATWAPVATGTQTLHLGAWASHENANQGSSNLSASASYAGRRGPSLNVATTTGASGDTVDAYGFELAGRYGAFFLQGEYVGARFDQPIGPTQDVETYYVQGSVMLNGGSKIYKPGTGVFGSPNMVLPPTVSGGQPVYTKGLWELTGRYDSIENQDIANREASTWTLGLNYYINSNMRVMFNYIQGDNEVNGDETAQYAIRTQLAF